LVSKKANIYVLLGTRKGAFIFQSDSRRRKWKMKGPFFENAPVFHMAFDQRDGKSIYAAVNSGHFGPTIQRTKNLGRSWENSKTPPRFAEGSGLKVENIWHVEPGHSDEPDVVYAGVAPAGLFRSEDGGDNWKLNENLNNHPTRPKWEPGAGGLCLHSIIIDSSRPKRMYLGISAVGVFKSEDGGQSWTTKNRNVRADFLPDKYPEFSQCVHKLVMDPNSPSHLYQQNHCGVYRTEDGAENWTEVSKGLPSGFGFPMASHPHDSKKFYVVPEEGDFYRVSAKQEFAVYGTSNAGNTWKRLNKGLPGKPAFLGCYREGLATDSLDPVGLYVGTRMGHVFSSANEGKNWQILTQWLPPVYSVSTAPID
jgi:hypothetical protein